MCANYLPTTRERLAKYFGVEFANDAFAAESYPGSMAPIVRKSQDGAAKECIAACFGMVPHWADLKLARQTYNARSETVAQKPSFRSAFKHAQWCLIPFDAFFEPNYETGQAVRWKISPLDDAPLAIAGIWEVRKNAPGLGHHGEQAFFSFSMLTINADAHSLCARFHKPGDEKRMPVILPREKWDEWLMTTSDAAPQFFTPYPAEFLQAEAAPRITAAPHTKAQAKPGPTLF